MQLSLQVLLLLASYQGPALALSVSNEHALSTRQAPDMPEELKLDRGKFKDGTYGVLYNPDDADSRETAQQTCIKNCGTEGGHGGFNVVAFPKGHELEFKPVAYDGIALGRCFCDGEDIPLVDEVMELTAKGLKEHEEFLEVIGAIIKVGESISPLVIDKIMDSAACPIIMNLLDTAIAVGMNGFPAGRVVGPAVDLLLETTSKLSNTDKPNGIASAFAGWLGLGCGESEFADKVDQYFGVIVDVASMRGFKTGPSRPPGTPKSPDKPDKPDTPSRPTPSAPRTTQPDRPKSSTEDSKPSDASKSDKSSSKSDSKTSTSSSSSSASKSASKTSTSSSSDSDSTSKTSSSSASRTSSSSSSSDSDSKTTSSSSAKSSSDSDSKTTSSSTKSSSNSASRTSSNSASRTSSSTSSTSSSSSACERRSTKTRGSARPTKRAGPGTSPAYDPLDDCETDEFIGLLRQYDTNMGAREQLLSKWILPRLVTQSTPAPDTCMFYIGQKELPKPADIAQLNRIKGFKTTIESIFYPYDVGCFDDKLQPRRGIRKADPSGKLEHLYWRATSRAMARLCRGMSFLIYDEPYTGDEKGFKGDPAIFGTDEFPELKTNVLTTHVYQVSTFLGEKWAADSNDEIITHMYTNPQNMPADLLGGKIPVMQLWPEEKPKA